MPTKDPAAQIDQRMEQASQALNETDYFAAERLAAEALAIAHAERDFDRMARIALPLQEARRQKRLTAADTGKVVRLSESIPDDEQTEPACYLIEPMLVGADARNLRDQADRLQIPTLVVCREPATREGNWPVVMIGPVTVRAYVTPPVDDEPTVEWMLAASEALGDAAIASVKPDAEPEARVNALLDRLGTCREHEKLHQRLEEACRELAHAHT
jgi:hypothetical protein